MYTVNANQESGKKDTVWIFLAEYSLDELLWLVDGRWEPVAGLLFQDLGIPQEYLNPIIRTLADFALQAMLHAYPGTALAIRIFCQEKILMVEIPAKTMRPIPTIAGSKINLQPDPNMSGGWGYFLVERGADFPEGQPENSPNLIDLYLYREGK